MMGGAWQFRVLNFPVRVHFSFFLIALLLGLRVGNLIYLAIWVGIVFVSVLLHELGHAVAAEYYGRDPSIELYQMGGRTITTRHSLLSYPKEILISFAGPLAGFTLGAILFAVNSFVGPVREPILAFIIGQALWVNIGWGIINLVPILPLDGGNIMRNFYHWLRNPYDERTPLLISIVFGVLIILVSLVWLRSIYLALVVAFLTYRNYTLYKQGYFSDPLF